MALLAMLTVMVLALVLPADALTTTQTESFSGQFDFLGVTPFDPAMGTLDRVVVSINGQLTVSGVTGQNMLPLGPFGASLPQPYPYTLDIQQSFFGLANRYFEFSDPATFHFMGTASGAGEPLSFMSQFSYDFEFNVGSDPIGFTLPMTTGVVPPPGGIIGTRARFIDNGIPINEIDLVQQFTLGGQQPNTSPTMITSLSAGGSLQITYEYTPVPEPATLLLLGLGLALGAAATCRKAGA
jgi:hypothetical protein